MTLKLKPIEDQVMVITGASSGIGLCTARMAAKRGARLVLAARNEQALARLCDEINTTGGECIYVTADVGRESDIKKIEGEALSKFKTFDTWINNAGVSIYGEMLDIATEDFRRLFDTNFWGVVYGSLTAARNLEITGGALINVGSTLSDRAIPLQGMYCASKHAVKGFTDALQMELEASEKPVSVTLVKPSAIDTPYMQHAKNYLGNEPDNGPAVYAPDAVAETILYCAENPVRDVFVGAAGKALSVLGKYAPRLTDKFMENVMFERLTTKQSTDGRAKDGLYMSKDDSLTERGEHVGHVAESSLYTTASLHPAITSAVATGAALALGAGLAYSILRKNQSH